MRRPHREPGAAATTRARTCAHHVAAACPASWPETDGIGRFLAAEREEHFAALLRDDTAIRHAEGRATDDPAHYRALTDVPAAHPLHDQWRMRDLSIDEHDGLGAARHFERHFPCRQAEMDALPVADASVDLVVFNASLHYSTDLAVTMTEALRVLAAGGRIVVMDSPIHRHEADGAAMVAERADDFARRFGTRSDHVPSIGFLTSARLREVGESLGLEWTTRRVWYGWRWAWRPWRNRLRRRRAPSRFALLVATRRRG